VHIPTVIVRIVKFENSQLLTILLGIYSVALISLAFSSTSFDPAKIYIWTPITLTIDIGAMMQIIAFAAEKMKRRHHQKQGYGSDSVRLLECERQSDNSSYLDYQKRGSDYYQKPSDQPNNTLCIFVLLITVPLLCALIGLQIFGLFKAFDGYAKYRNDKFEIPWCSPAFQIGTSIFDRDCNRYQIENRSSMGIGCVYLLGNMGNWLLGTGIILSFEVIGEFMDFLILVKVQTSSQFHGITMRRPWVTMLIGCGIWIFLIFAGYTQTQYQPFSTGAQIGMVTATGNCTCGVYPGGLRSSIIAWSDGVFNGWRSIYSGSVP
jgi:hypothetical protein